MWFFKKNKSSETEDGILKVQVIPEEFYGGQDPVVHYQQEIVKLNKNTVNQTGSLKREKTPSVFFGNKKIIFVVVFVLLVFVGLAAWYYVDQAKNNAVTFKDSFQINEAVEDKTAAESEIVEETQTSSSSTVSNDFLPPGTSTLSMENNSGIANIKEKPLNFPEVNSFDSEDNDNDFLTNFEEAVFSTNQDKWDTDGDGYYDSQEVVNLYNPIGIAPVKLIDSGLIAEYSNYNLGYRVYYPASWLPSSVDASSNLVLFSAVNGDFISVEAYTKNSGELFVDWFAKMATDQRYTDLISFKNRFQESALKRADGLVVYFEQNDKVFVLIYHAVDKNSINYRHVLEMMSNSFRPAKTIVKLPEQKPLPLEPSPVVSTTTTSP